MTDCREHLATVQIWGNVFKCSTCGKVFKDETKPVRQSLQARKRALERMHVVKVRELPK